jgi:hypothetical protein
VAFAGRTRRSQLGQFRDFALTVLTANGSHYACVAVWRENRQLNGFRRWRYSRRDKGHQLTVHEPDQCCWPAKSVGSQIRKISTSFPMPLVLLYFDFPSSLTLKPY